MLSSPAALPGPTSDADWNVSLFSMSLPQLVPPGSLAGTSDLLGLGKPVSVAPRSIGVRTTLNAAAELNLAVYAFFTASGSTAVLTTFGAPDGLGIR